MAFSKEKKGDMLTHYEDWLKRSQAVFFLQYNKMTQKELDSLRNRIREAGGEFHIIKNTIMRRAVEEAGLQPGTFFDGTSLAGFAFHDAPAVAKIFSDATRNADMFKLKGGYLGSQAITAASVKSLADLPPLPIMRARLLGVLQAPAAQVVRTIAEPARSLASVVRAYSEKDAQTAAA